MTFSVMNKKIKYINDTFDLNENNFILYAARHYDNPHCSDIEEFYNDLQIPTHLKKLFTRYQSNNDELRDRLILNHFISFFNVFLPFAAVKILFYKLEEKHFVYLKTFLFYLNRCPDIILVNGKYINTDEIEIDTVLLNQLNKI